MLEQDWKRDLKKLRNGKKQSSMKCGVSWLLLMPMLIMFTSCSKSMTSSPPKPPVYVSDSKKIVILDPNDPNSVPWGWVAISPGRFVEYVQMEGILREHGLLGEV